MSELYHVYQPSLVKTPNHSSKLERIKDEVIQYSLSGHTITEISSHFGAHYASVYKFLQKHGIIAKSRRASPGADIMTRFNRFIEQQPNGCWLWKGSKNENGYGRITIKGEDKSSKSYKAHRLAYVLYKGPIPEGLAIDHLCCNPPCVNPDHLEAVTVAENNRRQRMRAKGKPRTDWKKFYISLYREVYSKDATEEECIRYAKEHFDMS